jgi:hypothetical protein
MTMELERVVEWYRVQCNGDWEHQNGVKLDTLDNPGWSLNVHLTDTDVAATLLPWTTIERSETDWLFYEVKDDLFRGRCGVGNLVEMLGVFLKFVEEAGA